MPGGTGFGGVVKGDRVEELPGDLLAAVQDRLDGGAADEVGVLAAVRVKGPAVVAPMADLDPVGVDGPPGRREQLDVVVFRQRDRA
jgi:hypothetical protein